MQIQPHLKLADQMGELLSGHPADEVMHAVMVVMCFLLHQRKLSVESIVPLLEQVYGDTQWAVTAANGRMN